jgi:YrbI family 3-deoxy-D-manno-octulosonate 8-phosphate phosphatase
VNSSDFGASAGAAIRLVATDFDGVMTDNRVFVFEDGREGVVCNRADGLACDLFRAAGVDVTIVSTERNPVVEARARKLGVPATVGLTDKRTALLHLMERRGLDEAAVMFVGNDVNDVDAMGAVGWPAAPADAHPSALAVARIVTRARGGEGVLRELADLVLGNPTWTFSP